MRLLAVDPGIRACGVSLFDGDELIACALVPNTAPEGASAPSRCAEMAIAVRSWCACVDRVVVEWPQVYRAGRAKAGADPNDLLLLAGVAGALASEYGYAVVESVLPREWKGTVAKEVMLERILDRLSPSELVLVDGLGLAKSKRHNVVDAVGIGLWVSGRLAPRRVVAR